MGLSNPPGGHESGTPLSGGAPIGEGRIIMLLLGAAYERKKIGGIKFDLPVPV